METTQYTPADVRELAGEIIRSLDLIARNYDSYEYGLPVMTHYDEMVDAVVSLLRTPRGEFCDLCGEEFNPSEFGTVIGPLGQDDGVPRWYRCPRCARAYDAGYQQGQRDPRGDETADPTALSSEAQGEVWSEVDDLLARLERFEYDAAGESEEYWRVVAMRDRIAAARCGNR